MNLAKFLSAFALGTTLLASGPALAIDSIATVPSLWPAASAFEQTQDGPVIATKGQETTADADAEIIAR